MTKGLKIVFVFLFAYLVFEFIYSTKRRTSVSSSYYFDLDNNLVKEKIEQKTWLEFIYLTWIGQKIRNVFAKKKIISQIYGMYQNSFLSKRKIKSFVERHKINVAELKKPLSEFSSFNDFFIHKLKAGSRKINQNENNVISPCDGKLFVIPNISISNTFFIKNKKFTLDKFLNNRELAKKYKEGAMFIFRLAPYDYHRFHFPFGCISSSPKTISGNFESVNPLVYKLGLNPLIENERQLVILNSNKFSKVVFVTVGALLVGKISFSYDHNKKANKADEFGFFEFGGSTIVLLFKKDVIKIPSRFIINSQKNYETEVRMGQIVAEKLV